MDKTWTFTYNDYDPEEESLREALCTLGNGYFATRGAQEENADSEHHYPGTYLAGGYNRLESNIKGQVIENEDLVNWPNWLPLKFKVEGGDWINLDNIELLDYRQSLKLKEGLQEREIKIEDSEGRQTRIISKRLVHMAQKHIAAIEWELMPLNWSGKITVHTALDGSVINNGVARYSDLESRHFKTLGLGKFAEKGIFFKCQTLQSEITMVQAAKTNVIFAKPQKAIYRETIEQDDYIAQELSFEVEENIEARITKTVVIYTSRDKAIADQLTAAQNGAIRAPSFDDLCSTQRQIWSSLWQRMDTQIKGEENRDQLALRLHLFHLLQTVNGNSIDQDIGVPSRGWHGEAYRGHILWDELFIFPILNMGMPKLTRSLLMYRYRRLSEARYYAESEGYDGAMFPWQSGSDGREESQQIHLNPQSGNWIPDNSQLQRHVNAAIAYNVWNYYQVTDDKRFMNSYGTEMLCDIAKFWASKTSWNEERGKYEICQVVGPDEYHTAYPDSDDPGINNNAYTNVMVIWLFIHAIEALEILDERRRGELMTMLNLTHEDIDRWEKISRNMFIPFVEENKIISQYEGFEELEELDWERYHQEYGEVLRLDRILEKEEKDVNRYKATKQADVLMLFYLFSSDELIELLQRNGYDFKASYIPDNIAYYEKRTSHGSTLSKLVHSWVLARSDRSKSWHNFKTALMSDLQDIQGGTTSEGIHLGAMAGTIDLIQRCYTGLEVRNDALWFNPHLPDKLESLKFSVHYRGHWIRINLKGEKMRLSSEAGWSNDSIKIMVNGKGFELPCGESLEFKYGKRKVEVV